MAIQLIRLYSLEQNYITIGGRRIQEWGSDTGVEYSSNADISEFEVGATGTLNANKIEDKHYNVSITVMQNSADAKYLFGLVKIQENAVGYPPLPYVHVDQINGDKMVATHVLFKNRGDVTYNKTAGTVTFEAILPYAAETEIRAGKL